MNKKTFFVLFLLAGGCLSIANALGYISIMETIGLQSESDNPQTTSTEAGNGAIYLQLEPPFVVNFTHLGELRYLQVALVAMHPDQQVLDLIERHMPAVRTSLILLLSDQQFDKLSSLEGKEQLRRQMLLAVNQIISNYDSLQITDQGQIFITNFVMQ